MSARSFSCGGCGKSGLTATGYRSHIQQSTLPECIEDYEYRLENEDDEADGFQDDGEAVLGSGEVSLNSDDVDAGPPDAQTPGDAEDSQDGAEEEHADQHQRELDLELEDAWEPAREPTNVEGDPLHQQPAPQIPATPIEDDDDEDLPPPPPPSPNSPVVVKYSEERPNKRPGCAISTRSVGDEVYGQAVNNEENLWAPFASKLDWEVARWAKLRGPGSTALTELLAIEGVVDALNLSFKNTEALNKRIDDHLPQRPQFKRHEVVVAGESFELYARDVIECIRALWQDPEFAPYLCFEPERHYADKDKKERLYHDMNTGRWWRATQEQVEQETGKKDVTIIPIIISSDKTQLTTFRNKQAYPPSRQAQILLAYLPTSKLDHIPNKAARRRALANLFHACLSFILEPLKAAGVDGIMLRDGNGQVRRGHPILACYVGDYPEQTLVGAVKQGDCAVCPATRDTLDEHDPDWDFRDVDAVRDALNSVGEGATVFKQRCLEAGIKPVQDPFWKELPFVHIYRSITPDVLHQLYQGVVKHVISWLRIICGSDEIDARCRRLPPNHNIRLFLKGISHLSRVTGTEHDQICRFLLGLIIDIPLPHGYSNVRLLRAVRSLLDFIHLARMPTFEKTRDIFIDLEVRTHFRIPKFHFLQHYRRFIELYGTSDNFNTEYTERLHIDMAKDAYRSTNHKDEYPQMTAWLDRRERILLHEKYIQRRLELRELPPLPTIPPSIPERLLKMALHPTKARVSFVQAIEAYGASDFENALKRFIVSYRDPTLSKRQIETQANNITLPFSHISTFHRIKFVSSDPHSLTPDAEVVVDSIHCDPAMLDRHGHEIPGRFDTALVHYKKRGLDSDLRDYRVARVRCIFSLPKMAGHLFRARAPPSHLVYVDWYTPFSSTSLAAYHGMHRISPYKVNGKLQSSVIPVTLIQQSVHLIPQFGPVAPAEWKSSNVLDMATHFFVNRFVDRLSFVTFACN
ncbi:hypothetical protein DFP72DRAFT_1008140 [Ephemerocybe angulata]|uniref:Uncharacterized protein n=1 Tax=Ephemerocybe angulata TaxID=980116 RepID=A0A8H6M8J4_9AGAR|nr:hypothetical protein DFP72DRAFT_1008140 [Tulosesus angulatus]